MTHAGTSRANVAGRRPPRATTGAPSPLLGRAALLLICIGGCTASNLNTLCTRTICVGTACAADGGGVCDGTYSDTTLCAPRLPADSPPLPQQTCLGRRSPRPAPGQGTHRREHEWRPRDGAGPPHPAHQLGFEMERVQRLSSDGARASHELDERAEARRQLPKDRQNQRHAADAASSADQAGVRHIPSERHERGAAHADRGPLEAHGTVRHAHAARRSALCSYRALFLTDHAGTLAPETMRSTPTRSADGCRPRLGAWPCSKLCARCSTSIPFLLRCPLLAPSRLSAAPPLTHLPSPPPPSHRPSRSTPIRLPLTGTCGATI